MKPATGTTICGTGSGRIALVVITVIFLEIISTNGKPYPKTIRLCSNNLSDALNLVCKGRGFNEPFSYSGEDRTAAAAATDEASNTGVRRDAGLVQECCRQSCSIEQLERYCKPLPSQQPSRDEEATSGGNAIRSKPNYETTYKIVSLPYSSVKEYQIASDNIAKIIVPEHRTSRSKKTRKKRRKKGRRKCRCRRVRKKLLKVSRETVIPKVPAFQVGTTSPEPIDTIVIFPFKSEISLDDIDGNVEGPDNYNEENFHRSAARR